MQKESIISFFRIGRNNPKLLDDRDEFKKFVDKVGEESFKRQKKMIRENTNRQKKEIMECYDKYTKIVMENNLLTTDQDALINEFLNSFIEFKGENDDKNSTDPGTREDLPGTSQPVSAEEC